MYLALVQLLLEYPANVHESKMVLIVTREEPEKSIID